MYLLVQYQLTQNHCHYSSKMYDPFLIVSHFEIPLTYQLTKFLSSSYIAALPVMTLLVLVLYISYVLMLFLSYQSSFRPPLLRSDERLLLHFILFSLDSQGNEHIFKKELHKMNHRSIPTTSIVRYT